MEPLTSCLYACQTSHQRLVPRRKRFAYSLFYIGLDLAEIPALEKRLRFLSFNRWNIFSIDSRDHLGDSTSIEKNLRSWLLERNIPDTENARIFLLTLPRVWGYGFNPVSFFFLSRPKLGPLAIAEVTNTYREMKLFPLGEPTNHDAENPEIPQWRVRVPKDFYVSPFSDPGLDFQFHISQPHNDLRVVIQIFDGDTCTLHSDLTGSRETLTDWHLLRNVLRYPLLSLKIIFMIHWQALRLFLAKVPYFRKADRREKQRDVLRPRSSLENFPTQTNQNP